MTSQKPIFRKSKAKLHILSFITLLLALSWSIGFYGFIKNIDEYFRTPISEKTTEAIIVLTGGSQRLQTGFELLEKGLAEKLFISGVYHGLEVKQLLALWRKSPQNLECCISLGYSANNTHGNAIETIEWIEQENYSSIRLVTSTYHMQRALKEFNALKPILSITPHPVTPETFGPDGEWWTNLEHIRLVIREYNKYILTLIKTKIF